MKYWTTYALILYMIFGNILVIAFMSLLDSTGSYCLKKKEDKFPEAALATLLEK
jgi:hypothetical protein